VQIPPLLCLLSQRLANKANQKIEMEAATQLREYELVTWKAVPGKQMCMKVEIVGVV